MQRRLVREFLLKCRLFLNAYNGEQIAFSHFPPLVWAVRNGEPLNLVTVLIFPPAHEPSPDTESEVF